MTEITQKGMESRFAGAGSSGGGNWSGGSRQFGSDGPTTRAHIDEEKHKQIEKRAYEHFLARKGRDGSPLEDWLRAEREVLGSATESGASGFERRASSDRSIPENRAETAISAEMNRGTPEWAVARPTKR